MCCTGGSLPMQPPPPTGSNGSDMNLEAALLLIPQGLVFYQEGLMCTKISKPELKVILNSGMLNFGS